MRQNASFLTSNFINSLMIADINDKHLIFSVAPFIFIPASTYGQDKIVFYIIASCNVILQFQTCNVKIAMSQITASAKMG